MHPVRRSVLSPEGTREFSSDLERSLESEPSYEELPSRQKNRSVQSRIFGKDFPKPTRTTSLMSSEIQIPRSKKDLFRAFLNIRPHHHGTDNEQYSRIEKLSSRSSKNYDFGNSSEFFTGGKDKGKRGSPKVAHTDSLSEDTLSEDTEEDSIPLPGPFGEAKTFCSGKDRSCIKVSCSEKKWKLWGGLPSDVPEAPYKPKKKYFHSRNNTYENIFGDRFELNYTSNNNELASNKSSESDLKDVGDASSSSQCDLQEASKDKLYRVVNGPTRCSAWLMENECSRRVMGGPLEDLDQTVENNFRPQKKQFNKHHSNPGFLADYDPDEAAEQACGEATQDRLNPTGFPIEGDSNDASCSRKKFPHLKMSRTTNFNDDPLSYDPHGDADQNKNETEGDIRKLNILITRESNKQVVQTPQRLPKGAPKRSECTWFRDSHVSSGDKKVIQWPECRFNFKLS